MKSHSSWLFCVISCLSVTVKMPIYSDALTLLTRTNDFLASQASAPSTPQPCVLQVISCWMRDPPRGHENQDTEVLAKIAPRQLRHCVPTRARRRGLALSPKQPPPADTSPQNYTDPRSNCQFSMKGKIDCFIFPFSSSLYRQIIDILLYGLTRA